MSFSRTEAEAAELVQQWVNYALNLGLINAGPEFLLMDAEKMAIDLCSFSDMFEEIEPEKIRPYVAVWRQVKIGEADVLLAAGVRQHGEPVG
jgi:hypothetical protein